MSIVSLSKILSGDSLESKLLVEACKSDGFFLLDLKDHTNQVKNSTLNQARQIFELASRLFEMPYEKKMKYEMDKWGDLYIGG